MKKIINGKVYNTQTSIFIGSCNNGLSTSDFRNWEESLYKSQKGQYFIYGKGGPMTSFSYNEGNMKYGGSDIKLIDKNGIFDWLEINNQHFCQDDIDEILIELGEVKEG